jgi:hypothetical protein
MMGGWVDSVGYAFADVDSRDWKLTKSFPFIPRLGVLGGI